MVEPSEALEAALLALAPLVFLPLFSFLDLDLFL